MYTDKTRNWSKDGLAIDLSVPLFSFCLNLWLIKRRGRVLVYSDDTIKNPVFRESARTAKNAINGLTGHFRKWLINC